MREVSPRGEAAHRGNPAEDVEDRRGNEQQLEASDQVKTGRVEIIQSLHQGQATLPERVVPEEQAEAVVGPEEPLFHEGRGCLRRQTDRERTWVIDARPAAGV